MFSNRVLPLPPIFSDVSFAFDRHARRDSLLQHRIMTDVQNAEATIDQSPQTETVGDRSAAHANDFLRPAKSARRNSLLSTTSADSRLSRKRPSSDISGADDDLEDDYSEFNDDTLQHKVDPQDPAADGEGESRSKIKTATSDSEPGVCLCTPDRKVPRPRNGT
jgi:hypothetical protein